MYKRILVATDGSRLSGTAIASAVALAKLAGATLVGVHARPPLPLAVYGEGTLTVPPEVEAAHRERTTAAAKMFLAEIEAVARKAGVAFEGVDLEDASPADAILRAAELQKCDLIVMASHGRKGLSRMLMGSETNKVLTHSTLPVLVTR